MFIMADEVFKLPATKFDKFIYDAGNVFANVCEVGGVVLGLPPLVLSGFCTDVLFHLHWRAMSYEPEDLGPYSKTKWSLPPYKQIHRAAIKAEDRLGEWFDNYRMRRVKG